jgi:hypothetical protein
MTIMDVATFEGMSPIAVKVKTETRCNTKTYEEQDKQG